MKFFAAFCCRRRQRALAEGRGVHATEDAAAAAHPLRPSRTSLAALLTSHVLHDGELVLLILKPSIWFIPLQSLIFSAVVLLITIGASLSSGHEPRRDRAYLEAAVFCIAGRLMWAVLQWMGRLYVLTDMRILRLSGVFTVDIFDCTLRKVAETHLVATIRERLLGLASMEIEPRGDECPPTAWQIISNPQEVHAKVEAAIARAKQSGFGGE